MCFMLLQMNNACTCHHMYSGWRSPFIEKLLHALSNGKVTAASLISGAQNVKLAYDIGDDDDVILAHVATSGASGRSEQNFERNLFRLVARLYPLEVRPFPMKAQHIPEKADGFVNETVHMLLPHQMLQSSSNTC